MDQLSQIYNEISILELTYVIASVLEELSKLGKLEPKYVDDFKASMRSREDANYRAIFSEDTADFTLELAKEFLNRMTALIKSF